MSLIKSIQRFDGLIHSNDSPITVTINAVDLAKTFIKLNGQWASKQTTQFIDNVTVEVTSDTGATVNYGFEVVELL